MYVYIDISSGGTLTYTIPPKRKLEDFPGIGSSAPEHLRWPSFTIQALQWSNGGAMAFI